MHMVHSVNLGLLLFCFCMMRCRCFSTIFSFLFFVLLLSFFFWEYSDFPFNRSVHTIESELTVQVWLCIWDGWVVHIYICVGIGAWSMCVAVGISVHLCGDHLRKPVHLWGDQLMHSSPAHLRGGHIFSLTTVLKFCIDLIFITFFNVVSWNQEF